jgi:hypothetical protein
VKNSKESTKQREPAMVVLVFGSEVDTIHFWECPHSMSLQVENSYVMLCHVVLCYVKLKFANWPLRVVKVLQLTAVGSNGTLSWISSYWKTAEDHRNSGKWRD